jgi:hypothetical protein
MLAVSFGDRSEAKGFAAIHHSPDCETKGFKGFDPYFFRKLSSSSSSWN